VLLAHHRLNNIELQLVPVSLIAMVLP